MASLTKKDIEHVAKLANLKLSSNKLAKFQIQLSKVVKYVGELNKVDTTNTSPTNQTTGLDNVYRKDEINSTRLLTQGSAFSGTEKVHNGYFVVDRVIDSET